MKEDKDLLTLYMNYLYNLREQEEYGDKYGVTEELLDTYEEQLGDKLLLKRRKNKVEKQRTI